MGPQKQSRVLASDKRGIQRSVSVQNTRWIGVACGLSVARTIPKLDLPSCEMCFQRRIRMGLSTKGFEQGSVWIIEVRQLIINELDTLPPSSGSSNQCKFPIALSCVPYKLVHVIDREGCGCQDSVGRQFKKEYSYK
jgi:hypothetical protein